MLAARVWGRVPRCPGGDGCPLPAAVRRGGPGRRPHRHDWRLPARGRGQERPAYATPPAGARWVNRVTSNKGKKFEILGFIVRATAKVISRPRFCGFTWRNGDSNLGPPGCRSRALPLSYIPVCLIRGKVYCTVSCLLHFYEQWHEFKILRFGASRRIEKQADK